MATILCTNIFLCQQIQPDNILEDQFDSMKVKGEIFLLVDPFEWPYSPFSILWLGGEDNSLRENPHKCY